MAQKTRYVFVIFLVPAYKLQIDDKTSSTQLDNSGLPQGSILGSVLFNTQ